MRRGEPRRSVRPDAVVALVSLLSLACLWSCAGNAGEEECIETKSMIALDQEGPWGRTPAEVFAHALGERVGSLTWKGGGDVLDVEPSGGETAFSAALSLASETAVAVDASKQGSGRLFCPDRLEMPARLELETQDGALVENIEVTATADGSFANPVLVHVDLLDIELAGSLEFAPKAGISFEEEGVFMDVRWDENGSGLVRGELYFGGLSEDAGADGIIEGTGVVHAFAEFQGEAP